MDINQFVQWGYELIEALGYLGLFSANFISTSTVFFPLPGYILIFIFGGILNPWFVALASALGWALGEGIAYGLGRGGGYIFKKKQEKYFLRAKEWFEKNRGFAIIVIFATTPLPFDIVGIIGGTLNYNFKKFLLATFIGKLIAALILSFGGFYGIKWILNFFNLSFWIYAKENSSHYNRWIRR